MCICINNCYSNSLPVHSGVLQGSVLGPVLFIIFIYDAVKVTSLSGPFCGKFLYADDAKLFSNNPSQLQHALDCFSSWICEYQLCLAPAKCAHLVFSRHSAKKIQNVFHINSEPVQTTSKARDLGVLVTDNLQWSSHINQIHSVASHLSYIVLRAFSTKNI